MQFDIKDKEHRNKLAYETAFYIMMLGYKDTRKFLYIPKDYITEGGFPLGRVWAYLQELYNKNQLSEEEIRFLLKIKMQLTDSPQKDLEVWLNRADEAENYFREHGSLSMPKTMLFHDGASMFQWVHNQKKQYCQGRLSLYQKVRLEEMGIQWIKAKEALGWEEGYSYAKQFFEENGHLFVRKEEITSNGFALGRWILMQRKKYLGQAKDGLSDDQIDLLEEIGMFWEDIENAKWDWFVGLLWECIRKTKKPFTISRNYRYKNYALGEQVEKAIRRFADGSLTEEKEEDLRRAGFQFRKRIT